MAGKRIKYLRAHDSGGIIDHPIQAFQRALSARGVPHVTNSQAPLRSIGRVVAKLKLMRQIAPLSRTAYLALIMQVSESRLFPVCYFAETIVYAMDVWQPKYDQWEAFFRRQKMKVAFISARQSAERMRQRVPGLDAIWLPEAIDPRDYIGDKPIARRSIQVLELGRRQAAYHEKITPWCAAQGYVHRYEKEPGQIIFPKREEFLEGLGDSKVSICFPSSMTHPARSGDVETMTLRYLESIAAHCVIVGRAPREMIDLFGYNPVVEADDSDPAGQLESILANPAAYASLIDRNYQRMIQVATWDVRADQVLALLRERGYEV